MLDFLDYKKELVFPTQLWISKNDTSIECFFDQFYDTKKFRRWFAQKPVVDIVFEKDEFIVGSTAKFIFRCLPFSYRMRCKKVIPNQYMEAEFFGNVSGGVVMEFHETEDGWLMNHTLTIRGNTRLTHYYYLMACSLPHIPFMIMHFKKLKLMAIMDRKMEEKAYGK